MRRTLVLTAAVLVAAGGWLTQTREAKSQAEPAPFFVPAGLYPDRIVISPAPDPARAVGVNWRTAAAAASTIVQIAQSDPGPGIAAAARAVKGSSEQVEADTGPARFHSVSVDGLRPATLYAYRVGDGEHWSEWLQFRTASDKSEPFSFIYFGDAQNDVRSMWSRVIRDAFRQDANARFVLHAGDLVNRGARDAEWGEWFGAGGWMNGMILNVTTPGNHEYQQQALTPLWRPQFSLPRNGPPGLEETCYYFDYQGARIISLNSNEKQAEQVAWLERVLTDNPSRWTILTFHHPLLSSAKGRDNARLRDLWKPVIDRHRVDLVLQGHDHTYARSNLMSGTNSREPNGAVYVVSVSGPKMYTTARQPWMKRIAEDTQLYQIIHIDGEKLRYRAHTATGSLYDAFELRKRAGKANELLEQTPAGLPERTRISPAAAR